MGAFVGRDSELAELMSGLEAARAGHGRLYLVVGEPGIGKSRLVDELANRAPAVRVAWGRCWEAGGAPPYWPWVQVLRSLVRGLELETLARELGVAAADAATLLPELRELAGEAPVESRFQVFDSVARLLARVAEREPVLVVLEDLHAADRSSQLLLQFVARTLATAPILVVATYRDVEARSIPLIVDIEREARERLLLRRLEPSEIAALVRATTGQTAAPLVDAIAGASDGNPLFVHEALRLASRHGGVEHPTAASLVRLSDGVGAVIRGRLEHLDRPVRELCDIGATIGRDFELALLRAVTGATAEVLLERLAGAVRAGVIEELDRARPCFRFSHVLIREAIYADLGGARRRRLHAEVAGGVERLESESVSDRIAELATHWRLAGDAGDAAKALGYTVRAGDRAMRAFAFDEAAVAFERAAALVGSGDDRRRGELLLKLARARNLDGDRGASRRACFDAAELGRAGDPQLLARAALELGAEITAGVVDPELVALLREAVAALPDEPGRLQVIATARLAAALQPAANPDEPLALARSAIEAARGLGDRAILAQVLHAARAAYLPMDPLSERLAIDREALGLAFETDQKPLALQILNRLVVENLEIGDVAAAIKHLDQYDELAVELRRSRHRSLAHMLRASIAALTGDFESAAAHLDTAEALVPDDPSIPLMVAVARLVTARARCDRDEIGALPETVLARIPDVPQARRMYRMAATVILARTGDHDGARQHLLAVRADWPARFGGQSNLAEAAHRVGDVDTAAMCLERLAGWQDCFEAYAGAEGSTARAMALAAVTAGRAHEARRLFERAIANNRRIGAVPWLAQTEAEYADFLEAQGRAADRERVAELRASARATAERLGMTALLDELPERPASAAVDGEPGLSRQGDYWTLEAGAEVIRLKNSKGMMLLAHLMAHPAREFHVLDLVAEVGGSGQAVVAEDAGPMLDNEAKHAYRVRVEELREQLAEAELWNDAGRAERVRAELEALVDELSRGVGLGGRDRRAVANVERARVNVQRRIADAIRKIHAASPALANRIKASVKTGVYCVYGS